MLRGGRYNSNVMKKKLFLCAAALTASAAFAQAPAPAAAPAAEMEVVHQLKEMPPAVKTYLFNCVADVLETIADEVAAGRNPEDPAVALNALHKGMFSQSIDGLPEDYAAYITESRDVFERMSAELTAPENQSAEKQEAIGKKYQPEFETLAEKYPEPASVIGTAGDGKAMRLMMMNLQRQLLPKVLDYVMNHPEATKQDNGAAILRFTAHCIRAMNK